MCKKKFINFSLNFPKKAKKWQKKNTKKEWWKLINLIYMITLKWKNKKII